MADYIYYEHDDENRDTMFSFDIHYHRNDTSDDRPSIAKVELDNVFASFREYTTATDGVEKFVSRTPERDERQVVEAWFNRLIYNESELHDAIIECIEDDIRQRDETARDEARAGA